MHTSRLIGLMLMATLSFAQYVPRISRKLDRIGPATRVRTGAALPATCDPTLGEVFFKTAATIGFYSCTAVNTWTPSGGAGTANIFDTITAGTTSKVKAHGWGADPAGALVARCWDANGDPVAARITSDATNVTFTIGATLVGDVTCGANNSGGGGGGGSGTPGGVNGQIQINNAGAFGGRTVGTGLTDDGANIKVNPAAVLTYLTATANLTHGLIAAGSCSNQTMTVNGAATNDPVSVGAPPDIFTFNLTWNVGVTVANTVTVRVCNWTGAGITPTASIPWKVYVHRSF